MSHQTTLEEFYKVVGKSTINKNYKNTKPTQKGGSSRRSSLPLVSKPKSIKRSKTKDDKKSACVESVKEQGSGDTFHCNKQEFSQKMSEITPKRLIFDDTNSTKKLKNEMFDCPIPVKKRLSLSQSSNNVTFVTKSHFQESQSPKKSPTSPSKSQILFSPRRISPKKVGLFSPKKLGSFSPKKLFNDETQHIKQAIENYNLFQQKTLNEFDLEQIYNTKTFHLHFNVINTKNPKKFELNNLIFPHEKHADHLMKIVMEVLSKSVNCGYFDLNELDFIFSLFTLSAKAQMLFVRLLKRKRSWRRTSSIKYPEVSENLTSYFQELIDNKFCSSDIGDFSTLELLNLLQADEVRQLCQKLKIDHRGTKPVLITKLIKHSEKKSLFPGAISPKSALRSNITSKLGTCVSLRSDVINIFDRILTLLHPAQDPSENISDLFFLLTSVDKGDILFPPTTNEHYPIFSGRQHLLKFVESKNKLIEIVEAIENKDWETVRTIGRLALDRLQDQSRTSSLPLHIQKFIPEYVWVKVLSKSVESFKKTPETIPEAVNILHTLIQKKNQSSGGKWYSELALIEMHHKKDLERSAEWTIRALEQENLTDVDVSDLIERSRKLLRRKNGIMVETKTKLLQVQERIEEKGLIPQPAMTKTISASMSARNEAGGKSTWSIVSNGRFKGYGSVELLALNHYTSEEEYHEGLHCEGALPVTLFTVLFWSELFETSIPGVFVSAYQDAPLDLFTADFFDNRKEKIEGKIDTIRSLDLESFSDWMTDEYIKYNQYRSVMTNNLFKNEDDFKNVVKSLGISGVSGICERLASNFCLWRAGFPDLIVWNPLNNTCKIVEVKGPGDSLSVKQKLWLQYLLNLGINVEVCHVEATGIRSK